MSRKLRIETVDGRKIRIQIKTDPVLEKAGMGDSVTRLAADMIRQSPDVDRVLEVHATDRERKEEIS